MTLVSSVTMFFKRGRIPFLHNLLTGFYVALVIFALFNYKHHVAITDPEDLIRKQYLKNQTKGLSFCSVNFESLEFAKVNIFEVPSNFRIHHNNPHVQIGGKWRPSDCRSLQRVAIIIPYRNRHNHLQILLNRLHALLHAQKIDYRIYVVEQAGDDLYNKGKINNVGFLEAMRHEHFDCFVFHDVDLIPEHNKNLYMCDDTLRHLSSAIDEWRYHVMFYNNAGGVLSMKPDTYRIINGYPNSYWGWGNEDDDLGARTIEAGFFITRPPDHIGRFKMIRHVKEVRSSNGYSAFKGWKNRWRSDGVNNPMQYKVVHFIEDSLYTNITVDIGPSAGNTIDPSQEKSTESLFWFIKFYFP